MVKLSYQLNRPNSGTAKSALIKSLRLIDITKLALLLALILSFASAAGAQSHNSSLHSFSVELLSKNLQQPWGFDFLPDGNVIITEKKGTIKILNPGNGKLTEVSGVPTVKNYGQGGLLDVLVHPGYASNELIFLSYSEPRSDGQGTTVMRAKLSAGAVSNGKVIFRGEPSSGTGYHFGSRIRIGGDGLLYISHGDRGESTRAQETLDHAGKIMRIEQNGEIPSDNPFIKDKNYHPEIFTIGHRNPQGMAVHPKTGEIWTSEHGAKGGDEINIIRKGLNYGWPVISYGVNYSGSKIGIGQTKKGMEQPVHYWDPSIAPAGMTFYSGKMFKKWAGNLLVASLKFGLISRLSLNDEKVEGEERLIEGRYGRIRDVKEAPDGSIYFITDQSPGGIYRISISE